jgi:hypothetical protein
MKPGKMKRNKHQVNSGWAGAALAFILVFAQMFSYAGEPIASTSGGAEVVAFEQAIRAKYERKQAAYATSDAAILRGEFYAPNVVLMAEGDGPPIYGRENVIPIFESLLPKRSRAQVTSVFTYLAPGSKVGYDIARVEIYSLDSDQPVIFKELFVWENIAGDWLVISEVAIKGEPGPKGEPTPK